MINDNSKIFGAVVITVCVAPETANQIVGAVERMPWLVSSSNFDAYISSSRRPSFGTEMRSADVCIAVVDFDRNPDKAAETAQYLTQILAGRVTVIALAKENDPALLLTAMRAGCSEFLYKPLDEAATEQMLDRFAQLWSSSVQRSTPGGTILSLMGAKGGVGTTSLAVHLATYLVQVHHKRTLLIDSRPELGHVCLYLGLDGGRYHFQELVRNVHRLDSELLQGFIASHPSGLNILSSPDVCGGMKYMDADAVTKTLEFLRSEYEFVLLDGAMAFDETHLAILRASNEVLFVATQEFAAIRDLSRGIDRFFQVEGSTDKLQIVINRFASSYAIGVEQIEKSIKLPVSRCIPDNSAELLHAMNMGETISPRSKLEFTTQMLKWSEAIAGTPQRPATAKKDRKALPIWKRALLNTE